jgi:photosystem II stability/assembly factor-like uncharacterized protein
VAPRRAVGAVLAGLAILGAGTLLTGCSTAAAGTSPTARPTGAAVQTLPPSPASRVLPKPALEPTPSPAPAGTLPAGADPAAVSVESVTFVSPEEGWVLGTVQCAGSSPCLALLRTQDSGTTWTSVPPPPTYPEGAAGGGVSEVRFADSHDGWVFGPELWATHNSGATWSQISLPGVSSNAIVSSLEIADGVVHAAVLDENATVRIETSPVGSDSWQISPTSIPTGAGPAAMPQLVLQGPGGWLIEDDRSVIGGARLVGGQWLAWQPPCLQVNGAAFLAASTPQDLIVVCDQGVWGPASPAGVYAYLSTDGGTSFAMLGTPLSSSIEDEGSSLASPSLSVAVITGGVGLLGTFDGGATWSVVYSNSIDTYLQYVGFETATQGVLIVNNDSGTAPVGSLLMTFDGGRSWSPVTL